MEQGIGTDESRAQASTSYQTWLAKYRERLRNDGVRLRGLETRWSWIRLISFVTGAAAVVLLWRFPPLAGAAGIAGALAFAAAILRHQKWEGRRAFAERATVVADESHHASTRRDKPVRDWQRPQDSQEASAGIPVIIDPGPTWPLTDQERDDLDLYGAPVGVFGLLNRTSTPLGARRLRDLLDAPSLSPEHIRRRQEAVRWLEERSEQRLAMMATLVPLRSHARYLDRMVRLLHETQRPVRSTARGVIRLWSVASGLLFTFMVLRLAGGQIVWARPLLALLLLNGIVLMVARPLFRRLAAAVAPWTTVGATLSNLLAVAQHASRDLPDDTPLSTLREHFQRIVAEGRIPSLREWLEWAGLHGAVRAVLNVIVFFDLHIAEAVLARVVPHRDLFLQSLSAMAELEALCSLAAFSAELPVRCYPQPASERTVHIEDGRHPLILESDVTPNSIDLQPDVRTWVITGPNAAGKSTFLRMVGVNVLLAQVGAAVPARKMTWSPVRLFTDVRIRDDLARHESYFLSEVRRLRRLVVDEDRNTPALGLIDEPFRGTNSQERAAAGIALLEHLMASNNLFVIATHEETLARTAAADASARNCHFQEHLQDGGIAFDYLLRSGPAGTKTALRILEREGYPQTLMERAKRLMTDETQAAAN